MERVNKILQDREYQEYLRKIELLEIDRKFCKHNITHFLDVCRIAWILKLEQGIELEKELIYGAGLLHDIGRWLQYESGEDHAKASERLCEDILLRSNFNEKEITQIKDAISNHRVVNSSSALSELLYKSDKLSRNCFLCDVIGKCKKFKTGKKPTLIY